MGFVLIQTEKIHLGKQASSSTRLARLHMNRLLVFSTASHKCYACTFLDIGKQSFFVRCVLLTSPSKAANSQAFI